MLAAAGPFLLKHWKLLGIAMLVFALAVQSVRLGHEKNVSGRLRIDNNELRAELKAISDRKNEQAERTEVNIEKAKKGQKGAETIAKRIEAAPLPGNCATPDLETLRNEL